MQLVSKHIFFVINWRYVWLYTGTLNRKENNTFAPFGACKQNNVTTICKNPKDFCNIFLFTPQSWSPKAPRVSLTEWESNGKLAHQNTSRLPDNRKRPCKLGALWQNSECALTLTLGLKKHFTAFHSYYCARQPCIKKTDVVGQGRAVTMPTASTNNGSLAETCVCATVWRLRRVTTFDRESHQLKVLFNARRTLYYKPLDKRRIWKRDRGGCVGACERIFVFRLFVWRRFLNSGFKYIYKKSYFVLVRE